MKLVFAWLLNALALLAVAYLVPGIHVATFPAALIVALVIALVNMLIRPILVILTLPITILTLGLFILVINGILFYAIAYLVSGFDVQTIGAGIIGALVYSVISWILSTLLIKD